MLKMYTMVASKATSIVILLCDNPVSSGLQSVELTWYVKITRVGTDLDIKRRSYGLQQHCQFSTDLGELLRVYTLCWNIGLIALQWGRIQTLGLLAHS